MIRKQREKTQSTNVKHSSGNIATDAKQVKNIESVSAFMLINPKNPTKEIDKFPNRACVEFNRHKKK